MNKFVLIFSVAFFGGFSASLFYTFLSTKNYFYLGFSLIGFIGLVFVMLKKEKTS